MSKKFKKIIGSCMAIVLMFTLVLSVSAEQMDLSEAEDTNAIETVEAVGDSEAGDTVDIIDPVDIDFTIAEADSEDGLNEAQEIDASSLVKSAEAVANYIPRTRATYQVNGGIIDHTATLTSSNPQNFYLFSTTSPKILFYGILASNSNVRAMLCFYDKNTGNLYDTGITVTAGNSIRVNALPADDYCIYVYSTVTPTTTITTNLLANYTVSNASINIKKISGFLSYIQYTIGTKEYVNDRYICDTAWSGTYRVANSHLNYTFSRGSDVNHYMSVGPARIKEVSAPVSFSSTSGASSSNAVLLYMDKGTSYCYKKSWLNYVPGGVSGTQFSFIDFRMGIETPRLFDFYDVDPPHEQILVYDINSGAILDFVGSANYFYASGDFQASMQLLP